MKKYKLIKEYPGSPKLGTINTNDQLSWKAEDYPQFWEEVVEKDYEILSLRSFDILEDLENDETINMLIKQGCLIHSVKRLSDGEIFTIGDDILEQREHSKIKYFEVRGDDLVLRIAHQVTGGSSLILISSEFTKYKQPLFTTEDGVDIFENDNIYWINAFTLDDVHCNKYNADCGEFDLKNGLISIKEFNKLDKNDCELALFGFSTKEKAEEYILMNKPFLSLQEVQQVLKRTKKVNVSPLRVYRELRELAQKKLNNK